MPHHTRIMLKPALCALAISMSLAVHAEEIQIPGLDMPVAVAAQPEPTPAAAEESRIIKVERGSKDLPTVPVDLIQRNNGETQRQASAPVDTRQDVVISNGRNTMIPISRGQINRIVTPFEFPVIQTVSAAEITTVDNVLYVTAHDGQPVTMFVTPEDDESLALSLTLLPQNIPPIQANLIFGQSVPGAAGAEGVAGSGAIGGMSGAGYSGQAKRWERSQPFMDTLRDIMRELAFGNLPRGYSFANLLSGDRIPACHQPGVEYDFSNAQYILGHDFRIYISVAKNVSGSPLELDHGACTHPQRVATSVWPHEVLEPGQKSEVFLVTRIPQTKAQSSTRPSLIN